MVHRRHLLVSAALLGVAGGALAGSGEGPAAQGRRGTGTLLVRVLNAETVAHNKYGLLARLVDLVGVDLERGVLDTIIEELQEALSVRAGLTARARVVESRDAAWSRCDLDAGRFVPVEAPAGGQVLEVVIEGLPSASDESPVLRPFLRRVLVPFHEYVAANIMEQLAEYGGEALFGFEGDGPVRRPTRTPPPASR